MDDPFALLGLPRRYDLDKHSLDRAYLARSAALHPDLAGDADPDTLDHAAALNRARETLQDPERRAIALWKLLGGGSTSTDDKALPPGFLMQVMEWREELEAAYARRDAASLAEFERLAEQRRAEHQRAIAALFAQAQTAPASAALLQKIKLELNAWRYTERLLEQLAGP